MANTDEKNTLNTIVIYITTNYNNNKIAFPNKKRALLNTGKDVELQYSRALLPRL